MDLALFLQNKAIMLIQITMNWRCLTINNYYNSYYLIICCNTLKILGNRSYYGLFILFLNIDSISFKFLPYFTYVYSYYELYIVRAYRLHSLESWLVIQLHISD